MMKYFLFLESSRKFSKILESSRFMAVVLACLLAACQSSEKKEQRQLSESKGVPCELVVVMDPAVLGSDLRDSVKSIVEADAPGLNAGEPLFRTTNISASGYAGIFTIMHSQLFFRIDPSFKQPALGVAYDTEATPQFSLFVTAPNVDAMRQFMSEKRETIQRMVTDFQLDRIATLTERKYSKKVYEDLRRTCGYEAKMPVEMVATKCGKDFVWGGTNHGGEKEINFVFYSLPWDGTEQAFNVERYVEQRDSVLQENIPGSEPGQYMMTTRAQTGQPLVQSRLRMLQGKQTLEVHGLWELKDGFMGGPFVSLVRVDTATQRIVVAEGFVFNPNAPKRDLLRQVEGALRTVKRVAGK